MLHNVDYGRKWQKLAGEPSVPRTEAQRKVSNDSEGSDRRGTPRSPSASPWVPSHAVSDVQLIGAALQVTAMHNNSDGGANPPISYSIESEDSCYRYLLVAGTGPWEPGVSIALGQ